MVKKFTFVLLLFFGACCFLTAQTNLDSLEHELAEARDTNRVNILETLARGYIRKNENKALSYAEEGKILAEKLHFESGQVLCSHQIAIISYQQGKYQLVDSLLIEVLAYYQKMELRKPEAHALLLLGSNKEKQGAFDEALEIQKKALEIGQSIPYKKAHAYALNNMANIYLRKANYDQAIATYKQAIHLNKKETTDQVAANTYRNIGIVYKTKGDYKLGLEYFYKALKINEVLGNAHRLAENWNSIGTILSELNRPYKSQIAYGKALNYIDQEKSSRLLYKILINIGQQYSVQNKLDSALLFYEQSLSLSRDLEGFLSKGLLFYNIGSVYFGRGDTSNAMVYYEKALETESDAPDFENQVRVWVKMGMVYLEMADYSKSIVFLEKALLGAKDLGLKKSQSLALKYLSAVYEQLNEPEKALDYYLEFILIKEDLFNKEKAAQIEGLVLAHEEAENYQKIRNLEQEKVIQRLTQERLWISVLAVGLIGFLLFLFQRKRIQYAQKQQHLLSIQKNWLELQSLRNQFKPHFVFNALASIQHFLIIKDTEKAQHYLSEFAQLMREMLENTERDDILLEDEIDFLQRYLSIEQLRTNNHFDFEIIKNDDLDDSEVFIPNLLLQTIVENAVWHGVMPKKEKGHIILRFKKEKEWLIMQVEDNGVGRGFRKKEKHISKGMNLLQQRIDALNQKEDSTIRWSIEDLKNEKGKSLGTKVTIEYLIDTE